MHRASCLLLALGLAATAARADLPLETLGQVETLPEPPGSHWVFVSDRAVTVEVDESDPPRERSHNDGAEPILG